MTNLKFASVAVLPAIAPGLAGFVTGSPTRGVSDDDLDLDQAHPQYGPLLQVMPWSAFRKLTDEDIRAIYEYLSALPPNPNP